MRLLILMWRDLKHPRAGGSEVYVQSLAREWAKEGHDVTLFCAAAPCLANEEDLDGYRIVRRGSRFTVYREAVAFYAREGPHRYDAILDVVNTRPFMTPRWAAKIKVVPLIFQVAREVWRYEMPLPAALLGRFILEPKWLRAYRHASVLTISESSRQSLFKYGLSSVKVVPVGVDPLLDRPVPEKAGVPTAIFVGRLADNKRPGDAVAAHRILREHIPDAELWVVGDGPLADSLKKQAGPGVTFYGRVDAGTKQDLMASAHALVATSVREGWGMTVSEAGRLGTRSVAYDVPGLRDSVPAAGGVLTEANPSALAEGLRKYLSKWQAEGSVDLGHVGVVSWAEVAEIVMAELQHK